MVGLAVGIDFVVGAFFEVSLRSARAGHSLKQSLASDCNQLSGSSRYVPNSRRTAYWYPQHQIRPWVPGQSSLFSRLHESKCRFLISRFDSLAGKVPKITKKRATYNRAQATRRNPNEYAAKRSFTHIQNHDTNGFPTLVL